MSADIRTVVRRNMVKYLVGKAIFCPVSGEVMDVRTCVVLIDAEEDPIYVMSQAGWAATSAKQRETLARMGYVVDPGTVKEQKA